MKYRLDQSTQRARALLNINGLISKHNHKLLSTELQEIFKNNDIVCLTETWGSYELCFDVENFSYYELHRSEKPKVQGVIREELLFISEIHY